MKIRLGLVGLGEAWQRRHAPALHALSDRFEVRAVCEQVAHRAEYAAAEFGAATVGGFQALVRRADIDALLILSDQWYGPLPILAACDNRKAVYCAAGFDMPVEQAETICKHVDEAGIAFMAEFARRFMPGTLRLKELIATELGQPRLLFCHQRLGCDCEERNRNGRTFANSSRRELVELVDWCRYLVDQNPTSVTGQMHNCPNPGPDSTNSDSKQSASKTPDEEHDYQVLSLDFSEPEKFGSGPLAQISCSRYFPAQWQEASNYRTPAALQIVCANGIAFLDLPTTLIWYDEAGRHQESLENERPVGELLLTHFHRAVTCLVRNRVDLDDACRAISILQQARKSSAEGRRIMLT
ncbi:MAG: Gfo/Idh/MocA family oxidoreductase [Pirellulales bacterium]|nr:Gfo/Idh/MocA family oxidoreductase [Pirellulales bacterium]